jgi:transposase-like protein
MTWDKGVKWLVTGREAAMRRRKWDPKTKAMIVLQGLKGKPVAEICLEHQISQTQYYQWRDRFLANAHQVFTDNEKKGVALTQENDHLRKIIGDLTVELKKIDEWQ